MVKDTESPLASFSFWALALFCRARFTWSPPACRMTPGKPSRVHGLLWLVIQTGTSPVSPAAGAVLAGPIWTPSPSNEQAELLLLSEEPPPLPLQADRRRADARAVTARGMVRMRGSSRTGRWPDDRATTPGSPSADRTAADRPRT